MKKLCNISTENLNKGAIFRFTVKANSTVTISTYQGYHDYTINGIGTTLDTFTVYYAEDTTVEIVTNAQVYLYSIIIKPDQEAPEAATLEKISVSGQTTSFTYGDEFTYDLVVKANYSDGSYKVLSASDYTVTLDREVTEAGTYVATVTYGGVTFDYEVEFVETGVDPSYISANTEITFGSAGNYKESKLEITDTSKVRDNGGNNI